MASTYLYDHRYIAKYVPEIGLPENSDVPEGMGHATRFGIAGILTYDAEGGPNLSSGDQQGLLITPPPSEWWYIRALAARPGSTGAGSIDKAEIGWYRWASRWVWDETTKRWWWTEPTTSPLKRGLDPYEFPTSTGGVPLHNWTQLTKEYEVDIFNEQRWIDNSEIWERHIYPGEFLLLNHKAITVAGVAQLTAYADLDLVRYPMPEAIFKRGKKVHERFTLATVLEAMIGATPDSDRR